MDPGGVRPIGEKAVLDILHVQRHDGNSPFDQCGRGVGNLAAVSILSTGIITQTQTLTDNLAVVSVDGGA